MKTPVPSIIPVPVYCNIRVLQFCNSTATYWQCQWSEYWNSRVVRRSYSCAPEHGPMPMSAWIGCDSVGLEWRKEFQRGDKTTLQHNNGSSIKTVVSQLSVPCSRPAWWGTIAITLEQGSCRQQQNPSMHAIKSFIGAKLAVNSGAVSRPTPLQRQITLLPVNLSKLFFCDVSELASFPALSAISYWYGHPHSRNERLCSTTLGDSLRNRAGD